MIEPQHYLTCPFTVVIDSREQAPYSFTGLAADADKDYKPLVVPTTIAGLATGDYSIAGFESRISVERKSLSDLFSTLGQGRERFEREFHRLNEMEFAALVIEADWPTIFHHPPPNSRLMPKTIYRTRIDWEQDYPRVHWHLCGTRSFAEKTTFRILERFWKRDRRAKRNSAE